jgi:micrococcal nuclease
VRLGARLPACAAAALALGGCSIEIDAGGDGGPDPAPRSTVVTGVVDGDTIRVRTARGGVERVRILAIDTPESVRPQTPVECGARAAADLVRRLAPAGAVVRLTADPTQDDRDRYGRLLRYVEAGGADVGAELVAAGLADVYVFERNPARRVDRYRRLLEGARDRRRGVYGSCAGDFHLPAR